MCPSSRPSPPSYAQFTGYVLDFSGFHLVVREADDVRPERKPDQMEIFGARVRRRRQVVDERRQMLRHVFGVFRRSVVPRDGGQPRPVDGEHVVIVVAQKRCRHMRHTG